MSDDETKEDDDELTDEPATPIRAPLGHPKPAPASSRANGSTAAERAWEIRRQRMRRIFRRFVVVVGVPTLLAIIYYTLWADDEFVSETMVDVQAPAASDDSLGAGNFISNRAADLKLMHDTLLSHATLDELIADTDWRDHYRNNGDMFSRLGGEGSEQTYNYFRKHVVVKAHAGEPVRLKVRAFSGEAAAEFSRSLLKITERRINEIALRPIEKQLAIARHRGNADATTRLELALAGQRRYFTIISGPTEPDEARFPKRVWGIATVFVVAVALMGVFSLLLGAIREHAKV